MVHSNFYRKNIYYVYSSKKSHNLPKPIYFIDGTPIQPTNSIRDLGIQINDNLDFTTHINNICKSAYLKSFQLLRILRSSNPKIWSNAFKLYVRPILEYSSQVWNPSIKIPCDKIERVQKFFTRRALLKCRIAYTQYNSRLKKFSLLPLKTRRTINDLCTIYNILHGQTNLNKCDFFNISTRSSRKHSLQIISKRQSSLNSNSFSNRCTHLWNSLPHNIISANSKNSFKNQLILYFQSHPNILNP